MSLRSKRLEESLRHELNNIFLREFEFGLDKLVTITRVETSEDLKYAKVWVSVLPFSGGEKVIKILDKSKKHLSYLLLKKIRIKSIPDLNFKIDDTEEKASIVENELNKLK